MFSWLLEFGFASKKISSDWGGNWLLDLLDTSVLIPFIFEKFERQNGKRTESCHVESAMKFLMQSSGRTVDVCLRLRLFSFWSWRPSPFHGSIWLFCVTREWPANSRNTIWITQRLNSNKILLCSIQILFIRTERRTVDKPSIHHFCWKQPKTHPCRRRRPWPISPPPPSSKSPLQGMKIPTTKMRLLLNLVLSPGDKKSVSSCGRERNRSGRVKTAVDPVILPSVFGIDNGAMPPSLSNFLIFSVVFQSAKFGNSFLRKILSCCHGVKNSRFCFWQGRCLLRVDWA